MHLHAPLRILDILHLVSTLNFNLGIAPHHIHTRKRTPKIALTRPGIALINRLIRQNRRKRRHHPLENIRNQILPLHAKRRKIRFKFLHPALGRHLPGKSLIIKQIKRKRILLIRLLFTQKNRRTRTLLNLCANTHHPFGNLLTRQRLGHNHLFMAAPFVIYNHPYRPTLHHNLFPQIAVILHAKLMLISRLASLWELQLYRSGLRPTVGSNTDEQPQNKC